MIINNKEHFIEVIADNGMYLTTWKEEDDIKEFNAFSRGCFPLFFDTNKLSEISTELKEEYEEMKRAAEEADQEAEEAAI